MKPMLGLAVDHGFPSKLYRVNELNYRNNKRNRLLSYLCSHRMAVDKWDIALARDCHARVNQISENDTRGQVGRSLMMAMSSVALLSSFALTELLHSLPSQNQLELSIVSYTDRIDAINTITEPWSL
jgi:hypothetical protein